MYESSAIVEIQDRYRDKILEKDELKKYWPEASNFISRYFGEEVDEFLADLDNNETD